MGEQRFFRRFVRCGVMGAAVLVWLGAVAGAPTQADDGRLSRMLRSRDFRVRVQAAFALGKTHDRSALPALQRALHDRHPAVRVAAAASLGKLPTSRAIPLLKGALDDPASAVRRQAGHSLQMVEQRLASKRSSRPWKDAYPIIRTTPRQQGVVWPRIRYVLTLGEMKNRTRFGRNVLESVLRREVQHNLSQLQYAALFRGSEQLDRRAKYEIRRRELPLVRVDGNIQRLAKLARRSELAVRCEVSLLFLEDLALRSALRGAAVGSARKRRNSSKQVYHLAGEAVAGAVKGAMRDAPQALAQVSR